MMKSLFANRIGINPLLLVAMTATPVTLLNGCDDAGAPEPGAAEVDEEDEVDADNEAELPLRDGEERFGEGVTNFAEVEVGGTRFTFVTVDDASSDGQMFGLLEGQGPGGISLADEPALAGVSMLDLFLALTEDDAELPEELLGEEDHHLGPRGWFSDKASRGEYPVSRAICTNADFVDTLEDWDPAYVLIDGGAWWDFDSSPGVGEPYWLHGAPSGGCGNCDPAADGWWVYHTLDWTIGNVDAAKLQVAVCNLDSHPAVAGNPHEGPTVTFGYRTENNASAPVAWQRDMAATDVGNFWRWYWVGTTTAGQHQFDWRISIRGGRDFDSFDMGIAWDDFGW